MCKQFVANHYRSEEVNNEVALAALECAESFLTVCGTFLKPATHKVLFLTIFL